MTASEFTLQGRDGTSFEATSWLPDSPPSLVVQIAHGAAEHGGRYGRLAAVLNGEGYAVYADDHRGHGRTADRHGAFGVARPGGWSAMIDDLSVLTDHIRAEHPDTPVVLLGHSMGSFLSQGYVQRWGDRLAGVVFSGSSHGLEGSDFILEILAVPAEADPDGPSELFAGTFVGYNAAFVDGSDATGFEWLSRDGAEVKKYVDDPWCGGDLSNGFVLDMIQGMVDTWTPAAEAGVPSDLATLILSGDLDPVGGNGAGVQALADRYRELGVVDITLHLYPEARHELFNEANRDEVTADLLGWLHNRVITRGWQRL